MQILYTLYNVLGKNTDYYISNRTMTVIYTYICIYVGDVLLGYIFTDLSSDGGLAWLDSLYEACVLCHHGNGSIGDCELDSCF